MTVCLSQRLPCTAWNCERIGLALGHVQAHACFPLAGDKWVAISFAVTAAASVAIKNLYKGQADKLHLASQSCTFYTAMNNASSISYSAIHTGIQWGEKAAQAIMDKRAGDGSENVDVMTCFPDDFEPQAYDHQPDPQTEDVTGKEQKNYAVGWGDVASFGFADLKVRNRLQTHLVFQIAMPYFACGCLSLFLQRLWLACDTTLRSLCAP
jgi:hypothetical protein